MQHCRTGLCFVFCFFTCKWFDILLNCLSLLIVHCNLDSTGAEWTKARSRCLRKSLGQRKRMFLTPNIPDNLAGLVIYPWSFFLHSTSKNFTEHCIVNIKRLFIRWSEQMWYNIKLWFSFKSFSRKGICPEELKGKQSYLFSQTWKQQWYLRAQKHLCV